MKVENFYRYFLRFFYGIFLFMVFEPSAFAMSSSSMSPASGHDPWALFQILLGVGSEVWYVIKIALLISGIVGIVFIIMGLQKIRLHATDAQSSGHLRHGIILIIIGGLLFGTPVLTMLVGNSLFGSAPAPVVTQAYVNCQMVNGMYDAGCGANPVECTNGTVGSDGSCLCKPGSGGAGCLPCPEGSASQGGIGAGCETCLQNEVVSNNQCLCPGGAPQNGSCSACPQGQGFISGSCTPCSPGTGNDPSHPNACVSCGSGGYLNAYSPASGGSCMTCVGDALVNGQLNPNPISRPNSDATGCVCVGANQTWDAATNTCPCPSGFYIDATGACVTTCPNGYGSSSSSANCVPCPAGQGTEGIDFSTGLAGGTCQPCPSEYGWGYVDGTPAGFCKLCRSGTGSVNGMCVTCPQNTFIYNNPGGVCVNCPPNSTSNPGSSACTCANGGAFSIDSSGVGVCPCGLSDYTPTSTACPCGTDKFSTGTPAYPNCPAQKMTFTFTLSGPSGNQSGCSVYQNMPPNNFIPGHGVIQYATGSAPQRPLPEDCALVNPQVSADGDPNHPRPSDYYYGETISCTKTTSLGCTPDNSGCCPQGVPSQ